MDIWVWRLLVASLIPLISIVVIALTATICFVIIALLPVTKGVIEKRLEKLYNESNPRKNSQYQRGYTPYIKNIIHHCYIFWSEGLLRMVGRRSNKNGNSKNNQSAYRVVEKSINPKIKTQSDNFSEGSSGFRLVPHAPDSSTEESGNQPKGNSTLHCAVFGN